jgi:hypothetical protein
LNLPYWPLPNKRDESETYVTYLQRNQYKDTVIMPENRAVVSDVPMISTEVVLDFQTDAIVVSDTPMRPDKAYVSVLALTRAMSDYNGASCL